VLTAAGEFLDVMALEDGPLEITGCWGNISPVGAAHHEHSHPNNLFSGVYYVQTAPGANTITFIDPRAQAHVIAPRVKKMSSINASTIQLEAKAGRFFLFPGWLRHSVDVNASKEDRISVSFNVMLSQFTERQSKPRWKGHLGEQGA
jgi:uncharacterized protein (TIGR02466 family)